ncbi:unnamed protein product [Candidula unifasciata]|uniref:Uncharacterized protein n=1 Tax=Candidula unifasciata TaxID=100452 RepID=A0A8S3YEI0_9EUPU|nr:unnamed protein product [Candidula unifasciata]
MSLQHTLLAALLCIFASRTNGQTRVPVETRNPDCPSFEYDAFYDFLANTSTNNLHVEVIEGFTGSCCSRRGVLKLKLAAAATDPSKRRVLVDLFMDGSPTDWVFNLGDSITNNGYAGDGNTQWWDAEVQGLGHTFTGYLSDNGGSGQAFNLPNLYTTRLTMIGRQRSHHMDS